MTVKTETHKISLTTPEDIFSFLNSQVEAASRASLCPVDQRIENFLNEYLKDTGGEKVRLPASTLVLDRAGLGRRLSLPPDRDVFQSDIVTTYRLHQGILHNPKNDRRTTQGVFHIAEGGFPIPDDKLAVPKNVFKKLLQEALLPPADLMKLPFTSTRPQGLECFVTVLLRPVVCPEVKGVLNERRMEIRFFAPGNLIGNLDFVESIFGNGGDPYLPENNAALDPDSWTGHTGCVILAPHLTRLRKKDLGLPAWDKASERQRRDGMCWKEADELYNGGNAFKITCRDARGVIVTVIADNYFGYCKKEVKTQISYSANLFGLAEEEHSGGALAFASYDLGEQFQLGQFWARSHNTFKDTVRLLGDRIQLRPEGYAVDKKYPDIFYVPENSDFDLLSSSVTWKNQDGKQSRIRLLAGCIYVLPSGYKVYIKKQTGGHAWHLIGIVAEGVLCHKPCTVSGGGKSEISKSIVDAMIQGSVFVADFYADMERVRQLLERDYSNRFRPEFDPKRPSRPIVSPQRSLGSVIKLFTVSPEYTDGFNQWLSGIPDYIKEILLTVKRFYRPEWGNDWKKHFSVDIVNGHPGHELKFHGRKLTANYLRVGRQTDGAWRIFRVRQDFAAAEKIQCADDITASAVVPSRLLGGLNPEYPNPAVKFITNCENYLFQRPDDAIYRGYDKQAEQDLATDGTFISNFEPLDIGKVRDIVEDAILFDQFTDSMKKNLRDFLNEKDTGYVVSSAHPRMVDGKPSKNPRYLQKRPDQLNPRKGYLAETGSRLFRGTEAGQPVYFPVNAVLPGRRNNPPEPKNGVPALAVYNPVHYQELPELFMDFICSLTGKSPSTTGFGSEGALTKGPFNALWPIVDLNNAFVSFVVTRSNGFSSAAGYVGPKYRVDHDISLLVPEIWSRMRPCEQEPEFLIGHGYLEKLKDMEFQGRVVKSSILGYRITKKFVHGFLGRIFDNPDIVFNNEMLRPETQDLAVFADGVDNILETYRRVARHYFEDGSIRAACPPLQALLHVMAEGHFEGKGLDDPAFRKLFDYEEILKSEWYARRLAALQERHTAFWERALENLKQAGAAKEKILGAEKNLKAVKAPDYIQQMSGTIGADPFDFQTA